MGEPILKPSLIPVKGEGERLVAEPIAVDGQTYEMTCVSMGNPHAVVFMEDIKNLKLEELGPKFETHERFPDRVNTEFVRMVDKETLEMRVWERGSGETMACGTGTCAAVVAATLNGYCEKGKDIRVILKGGELHVNYTDERVLMTGDTIKVYDGVVEV